MVHVAPFEIGVELIIERAALVLVAQTLFGRLLGLAVFFHDALGALFKVGMDEHLEKIGAAFENGVGAAADDHAVFLLAELKNDAALDRPEIVLVGRHAERAHRGERRRRPAAVGGVFALVGDVFLGKPALFGQPVDQLMVIAGDAEPIGDFLADGASAAAKLASDGDDAFLFHKNSLLITGRW